MTKSPIVSFGLGAASAAMKAKSQQLGLRDRLALARLALVYARQVPFACHEAERFLATVDTDPNAAADQLMAVAISLAPAEVSEQLDFDWQRRVDLQ